MVTFERSGVRSIGALVDGHVVDLAGADPTLPDDMIALLRGGEAAMTSAREAVDRVLSSGSQVPNPDGRPASLPLDQVRLVAPIPRPGKILCIGLNYRDHAEEVNMRIPERPILFSKYANTVVGPDDPVVLPTITDEVDFEAELAVVIGKHAKNVSEGEALDYVAGCTIVNDVSARDLQLRLGGGQWVLGKTLDTFAPMGPALVTLDEVGDPGDLDIAFCLNGQTMQNSNTRNLIFGIPRVISYLSQGITLEPGDVIATGTPAGVGMNRNPPAYLKPGDVMEVQVERLGILRNPVVAEG